MAGGNSPHVPYASESYVDAPERYPIPQAELHDIDDPAAFSSNYQHISVEERKEHLVVARNSLELLSSILNSDAEPKTLKVNILMLEKINITRIINWCFVYYFIIMFFVCVQSFFRLFFLPHAFHLWPCSDRLFNK